MAAAGRRGQCAQSGSIGSRQGRSRQACRPIKATVERYMILDPPCGAKHVLSASLASGSVSVISVDNGQVIRGLAARQGGGAEGQPVAGAEGSGGIRDVEGFNPSLGTEHLSDRTGSPTVGWQHLLIKGFHLSFFWNRVFKP